MHDKIEIALHKGVDLTFAVIQTFGALRTKGSHENQKVVLWIVKAGDHISIPQNHLTKVSEMSLFKSPLEVCFLICNF